MKIIVSDFDETFYTNAYEENIKKIHEFVEEGNMFMIATGRNIDLLRADIEWYDIPFSYLICNDGAAIYDQNYQLLFKNNLSKEVVGPIFEYFDKKRKFSEVWIDHYGEHTVDTKVEANKIIVRYEDSKDALQELEKITSKYPTVTGYLSRQWINIVDIQVNKGKAISDLLQSKNIHPDSVYTIGDSINDISMITMYRGYTVENAIEELKKVSIRTVKDFKEFVEVVMNENPIHPTTMG